jgi:hypothetical protein
MIGAAGIESRPAERADISASKILRNRQRVMTVAAENGWGIAFVLAPDHRLMAGDRRVAVDARVKAVAALESDGDNVAVGAVVRALSAFIDADAMHSFPRSIGVWAIIFGMSLTHSLHSTSKRVIAW